MSMFSDSIDGVEILECVVYPSPCSRERYLELLASSCTLLLTKPIESGRRMARLKFSGPGPCTCFDCQ